MKTTPPWEHPYWYDLHDTAHTAGPEREPEHYRELLLALPPLDRDDHLVDVGAGTGKLSLLIARGYPSLGAVTVIEPNARKLVVAGERLRLALPEARIKMVEAALGSDTPLATEPGTIVTSGSVLMPIMVLRGGTMSDGLAWLRAALKDMVTLVAPGGWLYILETLGLPWDTGDLSAPLRRLSFLELQSELHQIGMVETECAYRFRDRVIFRTRRPLDWNAAARLRQ